MDNGFTLIEMLFGILIISIVATLISFNIYQQVSATNLETSSKQIVMLLENARSCALANNVESTVVFTNQSVMVSCDDVDQKIEFSNLSISTNFSNNQAKFYKSGVVSQGATIDVCNQYTCEKITIAIGRSDVQIK